MLLACDAKNPSSVLVNWLHIIQNTLSEAHPSDMADSTDIIKERKSPSRNFRWAYRLPISINGISLADKLAHEVNIQPDAPSHIICSCRIMPFKLKLKRVSGQSYCRHQLFRLVVEADANWRLQLRPSNTAGAPRHIHNNTMLLKSRQSRMRFDDEKCVLCCPS